MSEIFFADAWLFWALAPLFVLWMLAWWVWPRVARRRRRAALRYSNIAPLKRLKPSKTLLLRRLVEATRLVTIALLMLAMARPQTGRSQTQVRWVSTGAAPFLLRWRMVKTR